jgi:hypothetical protein
MSTQQIRRSRMQQSTDAEKTDLQLEQSITASGTKTVSYSICQLIAYQNEKQ